MRPLNLSNRRFGHLVAVRLAPPSPFGRAWICRCDCGGQTVVAAEHLRSSRVRSCGCRHGAPLHEHASGTRGGHIARWFATHALPEELPGALARQRLSPPGAWDLADGTAHGFSPCELD